MQKDDIQLKVGNKLKEVREKKNMTQAEVASEAEITVNYYAMIERGEVNPSLDKLHRIVKALHVKWSDIFPKS